MSHYELREFHGDYDLVYVNSSGQVITLAAEVHDRNILQTVADAFQATIIPEPRRERVGAQVEEVG